MNPYIVAWLKRDEGVRLFPYKDTATPPKWTLGIGRNLEENGISTDEAEYMLGNDIRRAETEARAFAWYDGLNDVRKAVILSMLFQLGLPRFGKFLGFIGAMERGDYERAAIEMKHSSWYLQCTKRVERLMEAMRTGKA